MKKLLFCIVCLFTLLCGCATDSFQQGKTAFQQEDFHQAFVKLKPLAETGNADAQYAVGYMYFYGEGIVEDQHAGINWMQRAAQQGQHQAQAALKIIDEAKAQHKL